MANNEEPLSEFVERMMAQVFESPEDLAAKELKKLYDAYLNAGFKDWQAFDLLRDSIKVISQTR